jgi:hypothetical protein
MFHRARRPSRRAPHPLILTELLIKEDLRSRGTHATYCVAC